MRAAVVIPSAREVDPQQLDALRGADIFIVEGEGFSSSSEVAERATVLTLAQQQQALKSEFELVGHGSAACRNFGVWWAWHNRYDLIINLDDDCWPEGDLVGDYTDLLSQPQLMTVLDSSDCWVSTLQRPDSATPWYPRGFPYEERVAHRQTASGRRQVQPVVHVGLWTGTLDLNAVDKVAYGELPEPDRGYYACRSFLPVCAMNFAVTRRFAPFCYQVPWTSFGQTLALERYDDIIGGLFTCAMAILAGSWVSFGPPFVEHRRKNGNLLLEAARENLGNVLISRLAGLLARALEEPQPIRDTWEQRAIGLLDRCQALAAGSELQPAVEHWVRTYQRWLALFA